MVVSITQLHPPGEAETIEQRRALAWAMRRSGKTIYTIADELKAQGFPASLGTISNDLDAMREEFRKLEREEATAWRDDMIAKLDAIIETQMRLANAPSNIRSADNANAARQAMERKAKLLGIDAPVSMDVSIKTWTDITRTAKLANEEPED